MNKKIVLLFPAFVIGSLNNILAIPRGYNHPSRADAKCARRVAGQQADFMRRPVEIKASSCNPTISKGLAALLILGLATAMVPGAIATNVDTTCPCASVSDCTVKKCSLASQCSGDLGSVYCSSYSKTCICHFN